MSVEKPRSIMCETCGGWHATEVHTQYEKEAREKRMDEIKARPDSAYRFDTLGFTPEQKGEIEPWMHGVIEKAKELGDDLQDSEFFLHVGSANEKKRGFNSFAFLEQTSFQESPVPLRGGDEEISKVTPSGKKTGKYVWVLEHPAGEPLTEAKGRELAFGIKSIVGWAGINEKKINLFIQQEKWLQTRDPDDLQAYIRSIIDLLPNTEVPEEIRRLRGELRAVEHNWPHNERAIMQHEQYIQSTKKQLDKLENKIRKKLMDDEERRKAVLSIQKHGGIGGKEAIGIIFHFSQVLKTTYPKKEETGQPDCYTTEDGSEIIHIRGKRETRIIPNAELTNLESARAFYQEFLHAIVVFYGSIEAQRETLEKMLEITQDNPDRRLPIYNFYGKLVWPRPPEDDK